MEKGMEKGRQNPKAQCDLSQATFNLDQVSYKTEQKQGRIVKLMLDQSVPSWVNTCSPGPVGCSLKRS